MLKKILRNNFFQSAIAWMISLYIKFCFHTSSWTIKDDGKWKELESKLGINKKSRFFGITLNL